MASTETGSENADSNFFFSEPGSTPSTRESSPAPNRLAKYGKPDFVGHSIEEFPETIDEEDPGILADEVYEFALAWWRAGMRRLLVRYLKFESPLLATLQSRVRNSWLDAYFVYTSALGTHTFFMMIIPALFFLGHEKIGLGSITILGLGGYATSFTKDLFCVPRPFAPPVIRLTISNHHLEYGFPSMHSANCASVALYIHTLLYRLYLNDNLSPITLHALQAVLAWYMFSIVLGRLYCGMHSALDCFVGVIYGTAVCAAYLKLEDYIHDWLSTSGWTVPLTLICLTILLINRHPQPVDDCPCFEDAIAFVSSIMGIMLGLWHAAYFGLHYRPFWTSLAPGSDWNLRTIWLGFAGLRLFFGVLSIFLWRLVAKAVFHAVLPPIFRSVASIFTLPNRRFYTPATDYERVPTEKGLHPIPSVIDLPNSRTTVLAEASATLPRAWGDGLKLRSGGAAGLKTPGLEQSKEEVPLYLGDEDFGGDDGRDGGRKHYDADVLTKVMVYTGIGMIASEWGPVVFDLVGWIPRSI